MCMYEDPLTNSLLLLILEEGKPSLTNYDKAYSLAVKMASEMRERVLHIGLEEKP